MHNRRREQLLKAAAPLLIADEHVEFATLTEVGSVSAARRPATTAVVGVLTAGAVTASPAAKAGFGLLLTTQLSIAGEDRGLKLTFTTAFRVDGRELLGRLPVTA
ncbi:hypothetical protein [Kitasatospora sp. NPDC051914]|uniref:hypothetical protein n=1 Tax=Kitasatospora sp. NPDC051914 TaxID=3154945 RepID=UPI00342F9EFA